MVFARPWEFDFNDASKQKYVEKVTINLNVVEDDNDLNQWEKDIIPTNQPLDNPSIKV